MNESFFYRIDPFKLDYIFNSAIRHKMDLMSLYLQLMIELLSEDVGFSLSDEGFVA